MSTPTSAVAPILGFQDSAAVNYTIQVILSPDLTIQKVAAPSFYSGIGQNITYIYTITNSGFVNFNGNIIVEDNKIGIFNISNVDLSPGQNVTGTANYTITQPDLDAGSVINTAHAIGIFNISNVDLAPGQNVKGPANYTIMQPDLDAGSVNNTVYATDNSINSNYATATVTFLTLPLANFSTNVTSGYAPLSVQFTDLSTNATGCNWSFGDGANSIQKNPTHTFAAGNYTVNETVSNTNGTNSMTSKLSVQQATPTITWSNPANLVYGTPLSSTQLDATASVNGTFVYNPQLGTVLSAGQQQTLNTTFTPTDSVNYTQASATVLINVINPVGLSMQAPGSTFQGNLITYWLYYQNFGQINVSNVVLTDTLPENGEFVSVSNGGVYNSSTGTIIWDIGSVDPENSGFTKLTIEIPQNITVGTVIINNANISTSSLAYNETQTYTNVTQSPLPQNVTVVPNNGGINGISGTLSVNSIDPITFSYNSCNSATGVDIRIHIADNGTDIAGNMTGAAPNWTYNTTLYPRTGNATVTYTVYGCSFENITFNIYVDPAGYIYDINTGKRIAGASVWLQQPNGTGWGNVPTGKSPPIAQPDINPLTSDADGMYQWDVLPGSYRVHVDALGYEPANSIVVSVPPQITDQSVGLVLNAVQTPALTIQKSASPLSYNFAGQNITYTYNVTNSGNADLTGPITVNDSKTGTILISSSVLAPGAIVSGTAKYAITQADFDAGSVTNLANATGLFHGRTITSNTATQTVNGPASITGLYLDQVAAPTSYTASGQTIKYTYTVTNNGNVAISAPITVTDDKFGTISIQSSGVLSPGLSVHNTYSYRITQADIDAGSVTNSAYATGSFNNKPIISPQTISIVLYKHPTNDRDFEANYGGYGRDFEPNYGAALVSLPVMYGSEPYGHVSEPYWYGSGPSGTTKVPNLDSHGCKAKVSSSKCSKAKLNGSKDKASLSKHKQKNYYKHHKAGKKIIKCKVGKK